MTSVEIVVVGNEVLLGLVQDTNSNYLCRVVRGMGGTVRRIAVVRDEPDEIVAELRRSVERKSGLIFTCGGLGPTDDDLTLSAVAAAAGREIISHAQAREFVERRYNELAAAGHVSDSQMTDSRLKMAQLPAGSRMIENPVGAAPAAITEIDGIKIVSLPGVPAELKAIVEGPLQPLLSAVFGGGCYCEREMLADCGDESTLSPILHEVVARHPGVYIKSRASHFGPDVKFRILISSGGKNRDAVEAEITSAIDDLTQSLAVAGITVNPT